MKIPECNEKSRKSGLRLEHFHSRALPTANVVARDVKKFSGQQLHRRQEQSLLDKSKRYDEASTRAPKSQRLYQSTRSSSSILIGDALLESTECCTLGPLIYSTARKFMSATSQDEGFEDFMRLASSDNARRGNLLRATSAVPRKTDPEDLADLKSDRTSVVDGPPGGATGAITTSGLQRISDSSRAAVMSCYRLISFGSTLIIRCYSSRERISTRRHIGHQVCSFKGDNHFAIQTKPIV